MGTIRVGGVRFRLYAHDHEGAAVPHVHARIGGGEVVIELQEDRTARLSVSHGSPISGFVKRSEVRKALDVAERVYDLLVAEWEKMHR